MKKKLIVGNWKMNYSPSQAEDFFINIEPRIDNSKFDVVVCPSNLSLDRISNILEDKRVMLGAQNVHFEENGAYTGETSASMLYSLKVKYCIVGHSERRGYFFESDESVNKKAKKLLEYDIMPIICVGETKEERESNTFEAKISKQLEIALKDISEDVARKNVVIAYEPIWAIGTGLSATLEQASKMCEFIKSEVKKIYNSDKLEDIKILYGGSVNSKNIIELINDDNIDGALVGGASITDEFIFLVNCLD